MDPLYRASSAIEDYLFSFDPDDILEEGMDEIVGDVVDALIGASRTVERRVKETP